MEPMLDKLAEEMDPLRSLTLFRNISNEDCEVHVVTSLRALNLL
jgi:hypothetical protein